MVSGNSGASDKVSKSGTFSILVLLLGFGKFWYRFAILPIFHLSLCHYYLCHFYLKSIISITIKSKQIITSWD